MQAYKFDTRISETGAISLAFEPELFNKEVEIIILPKPSKSEVVNNQNVISDFIAKWAGAFPSMTDEEVDRAKYECLMEKYK